MSAPLALRNAALHVALDIRHPLAYLALRPTIDLAREMAIDVDWLPLAGEPLRAPSTPGPDDDRGIRHRRHRAHMIAREIAIYAQAQGLAIREHHRGGSSHATHLAWLWVRAQAPGSLPAFLLEVFRRYWALELEPDDPAEVGGVLRALDLYSPAFEGWVAAEGPQEVQRVASALREAGLHQAPAYLVGDEVFLGRQHLPMIRWILDGRTGPRPI